MSTRSSNWHTPDRPYRILVADDDPDMVASLEMLLGTLGYEVHSALGGARAVEIAEAVEPDVLLLDLVMTEGDGCAVARRVRATDWGRDCLIVAVTGWGRPQDYRQTREAGFDEHLLKPADPEELRGLLDAWAAGRPARRSNDGRGEAETCQRCAGSRAS